MYERSFCAHTQAPSSSSMSTTPVTLLQHKTLQQREEELDEEEHRMLRFDSAAKLVTPSEEVASHSMCHRTMSSECRPDSATLPPNWYAPLTHTEQKQHRHQHCSRRHELQSLSTEAATQHGEQQQRSREHGACSSCLRSSTPSRPYSWNDSYLDESPESTRTRWIACKTFGSVLQSEVNSMASSSASVHGEDATTCASRNIFGGKISATKTCNIDSSSRSNCDDRSNATGIVCHNNAAGSGAKSATNSSNNHTSSSSSSSSRNDCCVCNHCRNTSDRTGVGVCDIPRCADGSERVSSPNVQSARQYMITQLQGQRRREQERRARALQTCPPATHTLCNSHDRVSGYPVAANTRMLLSFRRRQGGRAAVVQGGRWFNNMINGVPHARKKRMDEPAYVQVQHALDDDNDDDEGSDSPHLCHHEKEGREKEGKRSAQGGAVCASVVCVAPVTSTTNEMHRSRSIKPHSPSVHDDKGYTGDVGMNSKYIIPPRHRDNDSSNDANDSRVNISHGKESCVVDDSMASTRVKMASSMWAAQTDCCPPSECIVKHVLSLSPGSALRIAGTQRVIPAPLSPLCATVTPTDAHTAVARAAAHCDVVAGYASPSVPHTGTPAHTTHLTGMKDSDRGTDGDERRARACVGVVPEQTRMCQIQQKRQLVLPSRQHNVVHVCEGSSSAAGYRSVRGHASQRFGMAHGRPLHPLVMDDEEEEDK